MNVFVRDRATGATELVSRGPGVPANGASTDPSITPDGRYVVFASKATNLSPHENNGGDDVFVYDRSTGTTTQASRADGPGGAGAGSPADSPSISADGTKVAFASNADNLSALDDDTKSNVYVRDLVAGTTELVSVDGATGGDDDSSEPVISGDGTDVAFTSDASNLDGGGAAGLPDVFVRNLVTDSTTLVSRPTGFNAIVANAQSEHPSISHSGRYIAFETSADNLVDTDDDGANERVLRRDTLSGTTILVSRADGANGTPNPSFASRPSISADGGAVAFEANALGDPAAQPGVTNVYLRSIVAGTTKLVSRATGDAGAGTDGNTFDHAISGDGATVAFASAGGNIAPDDVDGIADVFVRGLPIAPIVPPQDGGGQQPEPEAQPGPAPEAQPAPPAAETPPVAAPVTPAAGPRLRMTLVRLGARKAKVRVACPAGACRGTLVLRRAGAEGRRLGTARFALATAGRKVVTVRMARPAGKRKVRAVAKVRQAGSTKRVVTRTLRVPRG